MQLHLHVLLTNDDKSVYSGLELMITDYYDVLHQPIVELKAQSAVHEVRNINKQIDSNRGLSNSLLPLQLRA